METLADFNFTLHHVPGKANMADPLTRQDRVFAQMNSIEFSLDLELDNNEELSAGYENDSELSDIFRRLTCTRQDTLHEQYLWNELSQRLYLTTSDLARLCIPRGPLRLKLLQENHDCLMAGHPGRNRTYWNLSRHFYWPRMGRDVKAFVRSFESCQRNKSGKIKVGLLQPLLIPDCPWAHISMDFMVGLQQTDMGFNAIFTFVDRLTKYVHLIPTTSNADAREATRLYINYIFPHHVLSKFIVSDLAPKFTSAFFQEVFTILGTQLCLSTANHPQTDGLTERINRVVKDTLRTFVNHRQNTWENLLPLCQFAINNVRQSSTDHTPFFLNHGYDPLTQSSLVDLRASLDLENSEDDPSRGLNGEWKPLHQLEMP